MSAPYDTRVPLHIHYCAVGLVFVDAVHNWCVQPITRGRKATIVTQFVSYHAPLLTKNAISILIWKNPTMDQKE